MYKIKEALDEVRSFRRTLNEHLLLFYMQKDPHHMTEILAYIKNLDELTLKGQKKLKFKDYYNTLFSTPYEPNNHEKIEEDVLYLNIERESNYVVDPAQYLIQLRGFYANLSHLLSENKRTKREVFLNLVEDYFGSGR